MGFPYTTKVVALCLKVIWNNLFRCLKVNSYLIAEPPLAGIHHSLSNTHCLFHFGFISVFWTAKG
jgi:hypothetical protein